MNDPTFAPALMHTLVFTFVSIAVQFALGLALALFFSSTSRSRPLLRALFLVPWLLPLIVSASTWGWMLNSDSGVVNSVLKALGGSQINWLTSPTWSFVSVLIANIWIGIPFNLVILYSGLRNISEDVSRGRRAGRRRCGGNGSGTVTFPLLRPVSAITLLLGLDLHAQGVRHHLDHDQGRPGRLVHDVRDLVLPARLRQLLPEFSQAAAVGNLLIVSRSLFGLVYLRVQRTQEA